MLARAATHSIVSFAKPTSTELVPGCLQQRGLEFGAAPTLADEHGGRCGHDSIYREGLHSLAGAAYSHKRWIPLLFGDRTDDSDGDDDADTEARLSPQVRNALMALIVGGIAAILDSTMVTLAIHTLAAKLHSTTGTIQWVTTGFLLAMAVAIPVTGWAERRWGGKRVWMAALMVFVLASVLCAVSWNDASLIGFRVLQGFGAGLIFPLMQTLAVRAAGGQVSSRLMAAVSLPIALGPILGPVIGGVILNWLSWRWLFLINVPVIAVGLLLAWRFLPPTAPSPSAVRTRLDWIGLRCSRRRWRGSCSASRNCPRTAGSPMPACWRRCWAGSRCWPLSSPWPRGPTSDQPIVDIRLLRLRSLGSASATFCSPPARRCMPGCSCCRCTTSNCGARACSTPGCC